MCDTATQGCNSNGHGEWARNIEDQFQHMNILQGFGWVHRRPKRLKGIGNVRVEIIGHMRLPVALLSVNSTKILLGFLESHEQRGNHSLLLSDESEALMEFVTDMREGRTFLMEQDDCLDVYRAEGPAFKVVWFFTLPIWRYES